MNFVSGVTQNYYTELELTLTAVLYQTLLQKLRSKDKLTMCLRSCYTSGSFIFYLNCFIKIKFGARKHA